MVEMHAADLTSVGNASAPLLWRSELSARDRVRLIQRLRSKTIRDSHPPA